MADGFSLMDAQIVAWADRVEEQLEQGMVAGMVVMEDTAKATEAYQNVTGATRAGTVGYVEGVNEGRFTDALQAVVERNPTEIASYGIARAPAGIIRGILTVPTSYVADLEYELAGARAFVADSLYSAAPQVFALAIGATRRMLR